MNPTRHLDYEAGEPGWRALDVESEALYVGDFWGTSVMSYSLAPAFTSSVASTPSETT